MATKVLMPKKATAYRRKSATACTTISTQSDLFSFGTPLDPDITTEFTAEFASVWAAAKVWALDIETYGNKTQDEALNPFAGDIRLIQVAANGSIGVFDVRSVDPQFFQMLTVKVSDNSVTIAHNAAFELQWLKRKYNIIGCNVWDTMIASQILYAGIEPYRHNLKAVIKRELELDLNKDEQLSDFGMSTLTNAQLNYSANDVRYLERLAHALMREIQEAELLTTLNIELGALLPYAYMGLDGFPICQETLDSTLAAYRSALDAVREPLFETIGLRSTANTKPLQQALSKLAGANISSTNKIELSQHIHIEAVGQLLDARTLENFVGYIERCSEAVIEGSVRGNFRQCAPKGLGRATCGSDKESASTGFNGIPGVNLHNPPNPSKASPSIKALGLPPVRSFFKPKPGQSLMVFDFSAAHARVAAQVTQDAAFIDSYIKGTDCHAIVASKLSKLVGKSWTHEDISKIRKQKDDDGSMATRLRNISKNIFYGWLNGAGKGKTLMTIHAGGLGNAQLQDAEVILSLLGATFTGIKGFHDRTKREIRSTQAFDGCTLEYATIRAISGRRVFAPKYAPKDTTDRGGCNPNEAYIATWMMVESDAKKRAMALIWKKSQQCPQWGMSLANECHDEIDVLCNSEFNDVVSEFCWNAMNGSLGVWVTDLPAVEDPYSLEGCLAESWASK